MDTAAAAFGDGWLHIDGRRTSFTLRAEDGRGEWRNGTLRVTFPDDQCLDLWLASGNPMEKVGAYFYQAANLWIADAERPEGESILPPLDVHPVARTGWTATAVAAWLLMGFAPVLIRWPLDRTPASMLMATVTGAVGAGLMARAVFALRSLGEASKAGARRLARESGGPPRLPLSQ